MDAGAGGKGGPGGSGGPGNGGEGGSAIGLLVDQNTNIATNLLTVVGVPAEPALGGSAGPSSAGSTVIGREGAPGLARFMLRVPSLPTEGQSGFSCN